MLSRSRIKTHSKAKRYLIQTKLYPRLPQWKTIPEPDEYPRIPQGKMINCSRPNQTQEPLKGKPLPCSRPNQTQESLKGKTLPSSRFTTTIREFPSFTWLGRELDSLERLRRYTLYKPNRSTTTTTTTVYSKCPFFLHSIE